MKSLWQQLAHLAKFHPRRMALNDRKQSVTYGDLLAQVKTRRAALRHSGCKTMALALSNGVDWVLWDLAALHSGICCVPLPEFFSPQQLTHVIEDAGVDTVLNESGLSAVGHATRQEDTYCKITYTSGSTGNPKGVCLTAQGIDTLCQSLLNTLGTRIASQHLSVLPLAVLLENVAGIYPALMAGSTIHLPDSNRLMGDPVQLRNTLSKTCASTAILVPELLRALLSVPSDKNYPLDALRFVAVGGAKVSTELVQRAHRQQLPVFAGYGLSECGSVVSMNTPDHNRPDSAGRVLPHLSASVEDGQIIIDNPLASGYLGQPPFDRLATGDCGVIDEDGYLYVAGRRDNLLITSWGRNVNPEWLESRLLDHPCIAQAIVTGEAQQSLSALIVAHPNASTDAISHAVKATNQELPEYARLALWRKVEPFTRANGLLTGNGRPVRAHIHKLYSQTEKQYEHNIL